MPTRNEPDDTYYELKRALREHHAAYSWLIVEMQQAGCNGIPEYSRAGLAFEALEDWLDVYPLPTTQAVTSGETLYKAAQSFRVQLERFLYPDRAQRQLIYQNAIDLRTVQALDELGYQEV